MATRYIGRRAFAFSEENAALFDQCVEQNNAPMDCASRHGGVEIVDDEVDVEDGDDDGGAGGTQWPRPR